MKRYDAAGESYEHDTGEFVRYEDHADAMEEAESHAEALRHAYEPVWRPAPEECPPEGARIQLRSLQKRGNWLWWASDITVGYVFNLEFKHEPWGDMLKRYGIVEIADIPTPREP